MTMRLPNKMHLPNKELSSLSASNTEQRSQFIDRQFAEKQSAEKQSSLSESRKLLSQELFRNSNTVCIEHRGEHYWLRLTRGKKLILTK